MRIRLLHRYSIGAVVGVALLMTACTIEDPASSNPGDSFDNNFGIKPTVPLKRRPIVPTSKLPRPRIIERINWTETGTLAVTFAEVVTAVVTIAERDGALCSYIADGRGMEIAKVPEGEFELRIDVADECYAVVVE